MNKSIILLLILLQVCSIIVESKRGFNPYIDLRKPVIRRQKEQSNYQYQWFTQLQDHFNLENQNTFQQRYIIDDSNYKPGGPVFMLINGEGPMGLDTLDPDFLQSAIWAQEFNALYITLEHRYYGASFVTPDLSTDNLQYLSSQQGLADFAVFRNFVAQQYKIPQGTKWVAFGGSYAGALTSWFRLKYPNLVDFVVASSAPVNPQLDFYQYLEVVQNALLTTTNGQECVSNIAAATQKIQAMVIQTGYGGVNDLFNLCPPLESDNDVSNFMNSLAGSFMGITQYNNEESNNPDIQTLCDMMTNGSDPLSSYVGVWEYFAGGECVDVSYDSMIQELQNTTNDANTIGGRMWYYQTATEFGYLQTSDSPNQPFGNLFGLEFCTQQFKDVFGFDFLPNVNWTVTEYGSINPVGSGVLYVTGTIDPWHALGVTNNSWSSPLPSLFINGTAHCADMMVPVPGVSPSVLVQAQATIKQYITTMLNQ